MMPVWTIRDPRVDLGFLPMMLETNNPEPAAKQFDAGYRHGGGWQTFKGHTFNPKSMTLHYPGDPPLHVLAETQLRDERIILFEYEWVMILQKDGSYEICRMD